MKMPTKTKDFVRLFKIPNTLFVKHDKSAVEKRKNVSHTKGI